MRQFLKYVDSTLGVSLPERSYADNCEISVENLWDQMDVFVVAHALGWFCKAIVLRDYWFCWILSVMFEFMEYSLAHQLPNFAECWWDHVCLCLFSRYSKHLALLFLVDIGRFIGELDWNHFRDEDLPVLCNETVYLARNKRDPHLSWEVQTYYAAIFTP